jgi:hypothetical protein
MVWIIEVVGRGIIWGLSWSPPIPVGLRAVVYQLWLFGFFQIRRASPLAMLISLSQHGRGSSLALAVQPAF